jgi:hypothetical protein
MEIRMVFYLNYEDEDDDEHVHSEGARPPSLLP